MTFFDMIWRASYSLAAASILTLFILIVRRFIIQAREVRSKARRTVLQDGVYACLNDPAAIENFGPFNLSDQRILLGLGTEMLRGITGDVRAQLLSILEKAIDQKRIVRAMERSKGQDRAKFAARLFWSSSPDVHAALRDALHDPSPDVILAAANALITAGQHLDLAALTPVLEARDMLGHRALRDLFRKVAPQNAAALLSLMDHANHAVVILAIDAVVRIPSDVVLEKLTFLAQRHGVLDVRAAALRTIGLIGTAAHAHVIKSGLADPTWQVKTQAATAAGRLRLATLLPDLNTLLGEKNWWVQTRAAQAIARLGDAGLQVLERLKENPETRALAEAALAERHA